jgi:hypothetical protein
LQLLTSDASYRDHVRHVSAKHFQQCAEFLLLRNRVLGSLAVAVLPIALASRTAATACACVYRKLDSAIVVMKAAEDGRRYDAACVLDGAMDRSVFVERPMSPQLIRSSSAHSHSTT